MSHRSIAEKRAHSTAKAKQKARARRRIPFLGVIVDRALVLQHRYLRDRRLPHSSSVASVLLPRTTGSFTDSVAA